MEDLEAQVAEAVEALAAKEAAAKAEEERTRKHGQGTAREEVEDKGQR